MTTLDNVFRAIDALAHTNRQKYKDGYKMNSPFDLSSDSMSFYIFNIREDGEGASYKYFAKDESGSLYDLAKRLNVPIESKRSEVSSSKRKYEGLADYAISHGVSPEYLTQCRYKEVTYQNRPALEFYTKGGLRYRFLDNGKNSYTSQLNYSVCWYGLQDAVNKAKEQELGFIVLCNGEISTISGKYNGLPTFCKTSGESAIQEHLLDELNDLWAGKIYIALDCDDAGVKASKRIAQQLQNGVIIDLMLTDGGDVADFARLHGAESLKAFKSLIAKQSPQKPLEGHSTDFMRSDRVLDAVLDELSGKREIRQVSFLMPIKELRQFGGFAELCETGKITLIAGGTGTGKTQFLEGINDKLNLAGINGLWYGAEWRADEMLWRRIQRWSAHLGIDTVTYDDIRRHRLWLKYEQNGSPSDENPGLKLSDKQWESVKKVSYFIKSFDGTTEYFDNLESLSDIFNQMRIAIERERHNNRDILYAIFDYAQLLRASSPDSSVNRYEYAFELVKAFAVDSNVHVFMTSQVNKMSQQELSSGKQLGGESAHFIRGDKANLYLTLNRQYYKRGDELIETNAFYLNIVKASLGGRPEGYTEPSLRIPLIMNYKELRFISHIDWRELDIEPFRYLPDSKYFTEYSNYGNISL